MPPMPPIGILLKYCKIVLQLYPYPTSDRCKNMSQGRLRSLARQLDKSRGLLKLIFGGSFLRIGVCCMGRFGRLKMIIEALHETHTAVSVHR